MPAVKKPFDSYRIFYWSHHTPDLAAGIYCYSGATYVGRILFSEPGSGPPANAMEPSGMALRYRIEQFGDVMEILREEKPLYLHLNTDNGIGQVATSDQEPTGEEEGG